MILAQNINRNQIYELDFPGETFDFHWAKPDINFFRDRNVLLTFNKNNRLEWLIDWMSYHNHAHCADGLLLIDNGSTAYSRCELVAALESVNGYQSVMIINIPLPFKPPEKSCTKSNLSFLQSSINTLSHWRWLSTARAVLSVDIDELVSEPKTQTIFDAAANSLLGAVTFKSHWVYAKPDDPERHETHVYRRPNDPVERGKYCYRPQSYMGRGQLGVHVISSGFRNQLCRLVLRRDDVKLFHYRTVSTSWKYDRTNHGFDDLYRDREAAAVAHAIRQRRAT